MFDIFDKGVEEAKREVYSSQEELEVRLGELQREMKAAGIPTVVVFEGWSASGKGTMIGRLIRSLDPRGFKVFSMTKPTDEERRYPPIRRYWLNLPSDGNISVFDRSWYRCIDFKEGKKLKEEDEDKIYRILDFESQLTAEGYLVIKFFLHISSDEQKKRFNKLKSVKSTAWRVKKSDIKQNENYVKVYRMLCDLFDRTNTVAAPWHVINTSDRDTASITMYSVMIAAMERALEQKSRGMHVNPDPIDIKSLTRPQVSVSLSDVDLSLKVSDNDYKKRLKALQDRLSRRRSTPEGMKCCL